VRGIPTRKLLLLGGAALAVLLLVGVPSLGQSLLDPQGELATADCYGHHKQEGFRSMDLFPKVLDEVPKGQAFPVELTIKNPWLHQLKDVSAYVNISDAPGLEFPGAKPPVELNKTGEAAGATTQGMAYGKTDYKTQALTGATEIYASVVGAPTTVPGGILQPGRVANNSDYHIVFTGPGGAKVEADPKTPAAYDINSQDHQRIVAAHVNTSTLLAAGPGEWTASVMHGSAVSTTYDLYMATYYNASQNTELVMKGPALLDPGQSYTFKFQVIAKNVESLQRMRYGGRADAHHVHTDRAIGDDGLYDKWGTMELHTGAKLSYGQGGVDTQGSGGVSVFEPVLRRWGQVLGFAGSFLIIPSLVFGGTFGRGSVTWMNKWFGGPRRRVLFHNSMSFWLLGVASLHMFIYFYEAFWVWSAGLVWGGLALAAMVGLGVTGATQRRFVARWGFNRWRYVHFAMGILVVVFTLIHMVADGSHFAAIRAMFGDTVAK
jgi:hypothetical protein